MGGLGGRSMADTSPLISIRGLKVHRGGALVLEGIDLDVHRGDFVGVVGPNGSGKSTLLLTIIGQLQPSEGSVSVFGESPGSIATSGRLAWVSQAASNLPHNLRITVRELVGLGTLTWRNMIWPNKTERNKRIDDAIRMVGLEDLANRDIRHMSGGQRQRAVVARGLASNAEILILDEPLVGVDRESRKDFLRFLENLCRNEGKTLLMVTHDHTAISRCTHCAVCIDGNVHVDEEIELSPNSLMLSNFSNEINLKESFSLDLLQHSKEVK